MDNDNNNFASQMETEEGDERAFDIWSDEGARRFNEMIEEGSAYLAANPHSIDGYKEDFDGEGCKYGHPDLYDPDEETLSPGDMEMIFENSYIT